MQTTVQVGAAAPPDWSARGDERIRQNVQMCIRDRAPAAETATGATAPEGGTAVEAPMGPFVMEAGEKPLGRKAK